MSVYVSDFNPGDGTWTVIHDEAGHAGSIQPADVTYIQSLDGSHNHNFAAITCPVCGAVSTQPVGGGAQPALVQEMFVYLADHDGCPCPADLPSGLPLQLTGGHVKQHCEQMDGVGRWQVAV
jgi:hypothetical protein